MRYREFAPLNALSGVIRCIWIFDRDAHDGEPPEPVIGDGNPELIVHFGDPMVEVGAEGEWRQPRALFAGQLTRPLWLRPGGRVDVLGIRFHPWSARRLLRIPVSDLTDRRVALNELIDGAGEFVDAMSRCTSDAARADQAQAFVAQCLARADAGDDREVAQCVARLLQPGASIDALAAQAGIGRRQLERRFLDAVGVSPRALAGILRLRRFFTLLEESTAPLMEAALAAGYYDQSHFIREFRRYAGYTPTRFMEVRPALATAILQAPDVATVQAPAARFP